MSLLALAGHRRIEVLACIPVALLAGAVVYRLASRELRSRAAGAIAALTLAAGLSILPLQIDRAATHAGVVPTRCPQPGATLSESTAGEIATFQELRRQIPPGDTYAFRSASGVVRFCALSWLLPRLAVEDPNRAEWLVVYGLDPDTTGIRVTGLRQVGPSAYLGRVAQ